MSAHDATVTACLSHEPPSRVAAAAAGSAEPVPIADWRARHLPHRVENMTTESLQLVEGTLADGRPWAAIAKTLRPASDAPAFGMIPPEHHAQVLEDLDWLDEPRIYESGLADLLPAGLRLPSIYAIERTPDRITIWMELVADEAVWDLDRYHHAARVLGRAGGAIAPDRADAIGLPRRDIGRLFHGKVCHFDLPMQADDGFWRQPRVATAVDARHRDDLAACAAVIPGLLAAHDSVSTGLCHGDATPDNLLGSAGEVVAIDWSYGHVGALGGDLGQLLAGRFESGAEDPSMLAAIGSVILDGYSEGLADAGRPVVVDDLRVAWATHLAIRSVFSALMTEPRPDLDDDAIADLTSRRAALARYGLDLVASVAG
jgi:tRNA A-37 threonylcarbamoyl transferase component Bud32